MKLPGTPFLGSVFLIICLHSGLLIPVSAQKMTYPPTRKVDVIDVYHGQKIADPYRWLEDDNSAETKAWVESQNKVTFGFLEQIPQRASIKNRLEKLWNYERHGIPARFGDRYFFSKNNGLQNQAVVFSTSQLDRDPSLLLDPNLLAKDGTVALNGFAISDDGQKMAYGLSAAGSDWQEWKVRDVPTGRDLTDKLDWVKFSTASWVKDGSGFFYSRYAAPSDNNRMTGLNKFQKLYFHRLGDPQEKDALIYERPDKPDWMFSGHVSEDGRFLIISVAQGSDPKNLVFYKDLQRQNSSVIELIREFEFDYTFIGNEGTRFWFRTDRHAPRGRVIQIDASKPDPQNWTELIPQSAETLEHVSAVHDQFIARYLKDAQSLVKLFDLSGHFVHTIDLPGIGSVSGFGGFRRDDETFYAFTSFTTPATIYRYDFRTGKSTVLRQPTVDFDPGQFETRQIFYPSKDGTRIPMFIVHKKGLKLDGSNPTCLYGYGGFNISLTPAFSPSLVAWLELGGVYAVPNLRGGGEYGEEWHQAGTKLRKQNVFDDFIAAAEWLITQRYTSPAKLAISGGSNGGLLVGACMSQRPELFAAALPAVGVMDMLRFHKFTIGWAWVPDYGSSDDAGQFAYLLRYSPLHNLKPGTRYPSTLVTTADHDDRVVPAHSFKFAARLQECQAGNRPVLIRIETRAGHGAGKPTAKIIEEQADRWAFLTRELGLTSPAPDRKRVGIN